MAVDKDISALKNELRSLISMMKFVLLFLVILTVIVLFNNWSLTY